MELLNPSETESAICEFDFKIRNVFPVMNDKLIIQVHDSNQYERYIIDTLTQPCKVLIVSFSGSISSMSKATN